MVHSRVKHSRVKLSRVKLSRVKHSRVKHSRVKHSRVKHSRVKRSRVKRSRESDRFSGTFPYVVKTMTKHPVTIPITEHELHVDPDATVSRVYHYLRDHFRQYLELNPTMEIQLFDRPSLNPAKLTHVSESYIKNTDQTMASLPAYVKDSSVPEAPAVYYMRIAPRYQFTPPTMKSGHSLDSTPRRIDYKDGAYYEGDIEGDKQNGDGTMVYANGDTYSGHWRDGVPNGLGYHTSITKRTMYYGFWDNNPPTHQGQGIMYHGIWDINPDSKQITMNDSMGSYEYGEWDQGRIIQGSMLLPNGSIYTGSFKHGKFHGSGVYQSYDGTLSFTYTGEFSNDKFQGKGVVDTINLVNKIHAIYEGEFDRGELVHGTVTKQEKQKTYTYTGYFQDYLYQGKGEVVRDGIRYKGEFDQGKLVYGTKQDERETYTGYFHKYLYQGQGELVRDGIRYEGEFDKGALHGKVIVTYASGVYYSGEWKNDKPEGQGVRTYENGARYQGGFHDGMFEGFGEMQDEYDTFYEGEWVQGKRSGYGTSTFNRGDSVDLFKGEWQNDHFLTGEMKYADGDVYTGHFNEEGQRHGRGTMVFSDQTRYEGNWDKGVETNGILLYTDGSMYEGPFEGGKPHGIGTFIQADGQRIDAEYRDGEFVDGV